MRQFCVYILCSKKNGTLYVGITNDIVRRVEEHKAKAVPGFTRDYNVHVLAYFELYQYADQAIYREKKLKKWNRSWKIGLIEESNPEWRDLYYDFFK